MDMDIRRPTQQTPPPAADQVVTFESASPTVEPPPPKKKKSLSAVRHHWLTVAFILGFVADNITLNQVDQVFDNLVLAFYVLLAMVSMLLLYAGAADKLPEAVAHRARRWSPMLMQYSFGGLLSGMLIFYGRAGAWAASWPYLAIILLAIYGNETIKDRSTRLLYNLAILFVGLFSYVVLLVPVLTGMMGPWIFVGSGFIALFMIVGFVRVLRFIIPRFIELQMKPIVFVLGSVFATFNFLYFANIIPPIPLSLKDAGIYHSVVRFESQGTYQVKYEKGSWWQPFKKSDTTIHVTPGESVFCFAQVFAPTKIATDIVHVWEYKDAATGQWVEHARIPYAISGSSGGLGYRGYTLINAYQSGAWRCSVETTRGQILGQERFRIDTENQPAPLVTEVR